jgi:pimeloyl-ACP methyl ester carboxylesterase
VVALEQKYREIEERVLERYGIKAEERWIDLPSPRVRVRVLVAGDGPTLVLVNGINTPGLGFAPLVPHLAGYRVAMVDVPGFGLSPPYDWCGPPVRQQAVQILGGVLDDLSAERATFIGNSLGGSFCLFAAADTPRRVKAVVLLGEPATALPDARGIAMMGLLTAPVAGLAFQWAMRLPAPRAVVRGTLARAIGRPAARTMSDDLLDLHWLAARLPGRPASFRSLLRRQLAGRTPRPECVLTDEDLARITQPVLFLWGRDDVFQSPEVGRRSIDKMPNARMTVVAGGHDPWLDDDEGCGRLVGEFLAGLAPA